MKRLPFASGLVLLASVFFTSGLFPLQNASGQRLAGADAASQPGSRTASSATSDSTPIRMKRSEAFLGIHFDFHAGDDCDRVGARTTREMVASVIDKVQPDYIQIDCKGHRGYSSYPTEVGNPAPGFVGDPLRVWRDVTRERGIALFMHYSGVWDDHAARTHPQWAAIKARLYRDLKRS